MLKSRHKRLAVCRVHRLQFPKLNFNHFHYFFFSRGRSTQRQGSQPISVSPPLPSRILPGSSCKSLIPISPPFSCWFLVQPALLWASPLRSCSEQVAKGGLSLYPTYIPLRVPLDPPGCPPGQGRPAAEGEIPADG